EQDQLLLGTGKRHIQNPHLLCQHLHSHTTFNRQIGIRWVTVAGSRIDEHRTETKLLVNKEVRAEVALIEYFGHAGSYNDWEFQSLALVDRHDPHNVLSLIQRLCCSQIAAAILHALNETQESEQTAQ